LQSALGFVKAVHQHVRKIDFRWVWLVWQVGQGVNLLLAAISFFKNKVAIGCYLKGSRFHMELRELSMVLVNLMEDGANSLGWADLLDGNGLWKILLRGFRTRGC
jgi:hypothetical protein